MTFTFFLAVGEVVGVEFSEEFVEFVVGVGGSEWWRVADSTVSFVGPFSWWGRRSDDTSAHAAGHFHHVF